MDATVYIRFLFTHIWLRNQTYTVAPASFLTFVHVRLLCGNSDYFLDRIQKIGFSSREQSFKNCNLFYSGSKKMYIYFVVLFVDSTHMLIFSGHCPFKLPAAPLALMTLRAALVSIISRGPHIILPPCTYAFRHSGLPFIF